MATTKSTGPKLEDIPAGAAVALSVDGAEMRLPLDARRFSTGSLGYYGQTKIHGDAGRRYQVGITVTLIDSKPTA